MAAIGARLATDGATSAVLRDARWDVSSFLDADLGRADVVTAAYVLGELPGDPATTVHRLWAAAGDVLVLVEPGSTAGFARILAARTILIAEGAAIAAPCPGTDACPLAGRGWCHFLARLDRRAAHRTAKGASRSWEDEPYSYLVASRRPAAPAPRVVVGRPRHRPGRIELRVCPGEGRLVERTISRRDADAYRSARDLGWGDRVPPEVARLVR